VVHRATRVRIGESLRNRLPYIDFVGEIVPAGISGELLDEPEGVWADVGRLTHGRNIARTHGASKQAYPAFTLPNACILQQRSVRQCLPTLRWGPCGMPIHPSNRARHGGGAPEEPCAGGETDRGGHHCGGEYRTRSAHQASRAQELIPKLCAGAIGDTREIETDPNGRPPVRSTLRDLARRRVYRFQTRRKSAASASVSQRSSFVSRPVIRCRLRKGGSCRTPTSAPWPYNNAAGERSAPAALLDQPCRQQRPVLPRWWAPLTLGPLVPVGFDC